MGLAIMRRQRSHTKPKRPGDLERLSIGRLRRLKDLTVQKIAPLELETPKFCTIVNDEAKIAGQIREEQRRIYEEQRRIDEQVDRIRNDPLSRRSGLLRIFKG